VVIQVTHIGERIKERRIELGMSQDELADRMGYKSRSTIAKIEKGINDVVQANIVKFAEVLNTSIAYLMNWEETEKKNDTITDAVLRMRTDSDFLSLVETLNKLDAEQIASVKTLLAAFLK
jgi:transcriptional regulator with XRE-family HTH domain